MEANLTKFNKFEAISNELTQKVIDITIKTPMDLITANALKKTIQENMKELEDMRTFIKKPFLDACTTIDNRGKELNFPFEEAKNALAKKLLTYEEEQEKKRMAEQKRINDIKIAISKLDTSEKIHAFDLGDGLANIELASYLELQASEVRRKEAEEVENQKRIKEEKRLADVAKKQGEVAAAQLKRKQEIDAEARRIEEDKKKLIEDQSKLNIEKALLEQKKEDEINLQQNKVKGLRETVKWEILDENIVPRMFCSSDSKKINEAIKKGITKIDGIKIFTEKSIR